MVKLAEKRAAEAAREAAAAHAAAVAEVAARNAHGYAWLADLQTYYDVHQKIMAREIQAWVRRWQARRRLRRLLRAGAGAAAALLDGRRSRVAICL